MHLYRKAVPGNSPKRRMKGDTMPRDSSTATCALRILDAATIFMALVILAMFLMALILCLTAGGPIGLAAGCVNWKS